jgi:hypothetical protein
VLVHGTYRVGIFDPPADLQLEFLDLGKDGLALGHVVVFFIAQELIMTLRDTVEARAQKCHVLRLVIGF